MRCTRLLTARRRQSGPRNGPGSGPEGQRKTSTTRTSHALTVTAWHIFSRDYKPGRADHRGLDIHRKQITFDYPGTVSGHVQRGQITPADREHLRAWLARFAGVEDVAFAVEGCTGWRYVAEKLAAAGVTAGSAQ